MRSTNPPRVEFVPVFPYPFELLAQALVGFFENLEYLLICDGILDGLAQILLRY
jgi:hypothetical protein